MKLVKLLLICGIAILSSAQCYAQGVWTTRSPVISIQYEAIAGNGTQFIAVNSIGKSVRSSDGITWSKGVVDSNYSLYSIVWANTQFVTAGIDASKNAAAFTSADGITWTKIILGKALGKITKVAWTGNFLIAVDEGGTFFISKDGIAWTVNIPTNVFETIHEMVWAGSRIMAIGRHRGDGLDYWFSLTSVDGEKWTQRKSIEIENIRSLIWTDAQIVAVGSRGVFTSPDAITWKESDAGPCGLLPMVWTGKQIVSTAGNEACTSPDGITWSSQVNPTPLNFQSAILNWAGNLFIILGENGRIGTSPDALNWTSIPSLEPTPTPDLFSIASAKDLNIAVGFGGAMFGSPDGIVWSPISSGSSHSLRSIIWTGNQFITVGDSGIILTSPTGRDWTRRNSGTSESLKCMYWTGAQYIAGGSKGTILTSPDANAWTLRKLETNASVNALSGNGTQLVAVGDSAGIHTSSDGVIWTPQITGRVYPSINPYLSITWMGDKFVAAGGQSSTSLVSTSLDGITWTAQKMSRRGAVRSIVWTGNQLVAIVVDRSRSAYSGASTSLDGITWKSSGSLSKGKTLNSLTWTGTQFILVGSAKSIYTSPDSRTTQLSARAPVYNPLSIGVALGTLFATLPKDMQGEKIKVRIYSLTGQKVLDKEYVGSLGQLRLSLPNLPLGRNVLEIVSSKRRLSQAFNWIQ